MIDGFTQRNSARENDYLDTEEYLRDGKTISIPRGSIVPPGHSVELSYDGNSSLEYIGLAPPGTLTSAAGWQIRRVYYSGLNPIAIRWADGNRYFDNVWDDRAGLTYS